MSYSYSDLLNAIITSRKSHPDTIHETLSHYGTFSDKCSMTPLLWLQYAQDSTSIDGNLAKEIIQLGIEEFPGCVLLWMYYLDCSREWGVWEEAMKNIRGTQGGTMLEFYRLAAKCFPSKIDEIFIERANMMLGGNEGIVDEILIQQQQIEGSRDDRLLTNVDEGRRFASQNMNLLSRLDEDVAVAMNREGIHFPSSVDLHDFLTDGDEKCSNGMMYNWDGIINTIGGIEGNCLMGMGLLQSASAFLSYAQQIFKHIKYLKKQAATIGDGDGDETRKEESDEVINLFQALIVPTYERAIAECPTVETIWEKYVYHLTYVLHDSEADSTVRIQALVRLKSVSSRAVKNCPYSVKLFTMKMQILLEEVEAGQKILEPDDLMSIVTEAVDGGFLPDKSSHLQAYMAACRIVKRRVLDLVSRATSPNAYDQPERLDQSKKKRKGGGDVELRKYILPLTDEVEQEVQDLVEDLREMWITTDAFLRNKFKDWTEGRQILFTEIAETEAYLCSPLVSNESNNNEVIKAYEKLVRVHHPPHPNSWRYFIRYLMGKSCTRRYNEDEDNIMETPGMAVGKLRFVRNLYHRAMSSIKKCDGGVTDHDYITSANILYQEFIEFERMFGSENSITTASKLVAKKISQQPHFDVANEQSESHSSIDNGGINLIKRKREDYDGENGTGFDEREHEFKKQKVALENEDKCSEIDEDTDRQIAAKENVEKEIPAIENTTKNRGPNIWPIKPKAEHKIKIGNVEYPAHPFTVHVSNLSHETLDMDLYDLFKSKCGAIVHARIFREKQRGHRHGDHLPKSKCVGLIQFEERDSVEKALELSSEVGLHEKLIIVTRSHQPAVSVVPAGCHRIKPKGQGKNTQLNIKRKERRTKQSLEKEQSDATNNSKNLNNQSVMDGIQRNSKPTLEPENKVPASSNNNSGILSFRPRNVRSKHKKN